MLALYEALAPGRDLRFLLDFLRVDSGFKLQELNLLLAELLALGTILLEPLQPEHFPQQAILLLEPVGFLARWASVSMSDTASPGRLSRLMLGTGVNAIANIVLSY